VAARRYSADPAAGTQPRKQIAVKITPDNHDEDPRKTICVTGRVL
jgi:hypothetical protein